MYETKWLRSEKRFFFEISFLAAATGSLLVLFDFIMFNKLIETRALKFETKCCSGDLFEIILYFPHFAVVSKTSLCYRHLE